jgi:hypothetical protein
MSNNLIYGGIMQNNNRPVHSFRYGNVSCAVWADTSPSGTEFFLNTTFARIFRLDDSWGESSSFEDRDLPNLMKAASDAHTWIQQQKAQAAEDASAANNA